MIDFTMEQLDNEKSPDLDIPLAKLGTLIFDSKHYKNIESMKSIPLQNFVDIKDLMIIKVKEYDKTISKLGKEGLDCLSRHGLNHKDCSSGWLWTYFNKLYTNHDHTYSIEKLEGKKFIGFVVEEKDWYTKKQTSDIVMAIETAQAELFAIINKARQYYKSALKKHLSYKLILQKITPLALIHQLKQLIEANYEENDIIHLSEVNRKISEVVNEQHAPFIYERIGQRYNHFLIDEFQDTSVIQWNNMLPLIDNSLASNNRNLLVGDTKQSIYRWRDGEVEQFAKLPELLGDNKSDITLQREALIKSMYKEIILDYNYRSDENIVNFNNELFTHLLLEENEYVKSFFQDHYQKTRKEKNKGIVKLINIPKEESEELINRIIESITDLKTNQNYEYGDICVLARGNKFLSKLANALIENSIKVVSSDALFLKSSNIINLIINIMNIVVDKNTAINSYSALRYFYKQEEKGEPHENIINKEDFFEQISNIGYKLQLNTIDNMDAYEISEYIISNIQLKNTSNPFIYNFLDRIIDLSKKKGASISVFLEYWEENKNKLKIDLASDNDSVQLLTIHKSKGLEFPVVILPTIELDAKLDGKNNLWVNSDDEIKDKLPKSLIGDYKYGLESDYKDILNEELNKKHLDSLNMLYVACTRPTKQLQVFFTHDSNSQKYWQACQSINWQQERIFENTENTTQIGETTVISNINSPDNCDLEITSFISNYWKTRITLQRDINTNKAIREKGTQLHNLLSELYSNTDIKKLINTNLNNNRINSDYLLEFEEIVNELLVNSNTRDFFNKKYIHHNEKEILTPNNHVLRPDKIIIKDSEIDIIDYKYINYDTISKTDMQKYNDQIGRYADILKQIHNKKTKGYILFLSPIKIVEIDL